MTTSTLLLILCISSKLTTTSCSKVPQGLHFPLGVPGLCTRQYFQRAPIWDSDNLVKPFMHVAIQTTRHYATLSFLLLSFLKRITNHRFINGGLARARLYMSPYSSDYIFIKTNFYVWRIVSEDSKELITSFKVYFLYFPSPFIKKIFGRSSLNFSISL